MARLLISVAVVVLAGCQTHAAISPAPEPQPADFGRTVAGAIEVCEPRGEREYLARLVCPSGQHPTFNRKGSKGSRNPLPVNLSEREEDTLIAALIAGAEVKPGEPDYHTIDSYEVICGEAKTILYLDMYHCVAPRAEVAPAGFTIVR